MTITNYMPTSDNHLFQNIDNEYIFYFEYDGIIYVFRSNNRLNNNTTTIPENLRTNNYNNRNNNRITNYYNNRNRINNYDYIRYDYIRNY